MADTTPYFSGRHPLEIRDGLTAVRYNDVDMGHAVATLLREEGFQVDEEEREEAGIALAPDPLHRATFAVVKYLMVVIHH